MLRRAALSVRRLASTFHGPLPQDRLKVSFSRSSGPGGQHVNKVNTKADVRIHVESADWLPEHARENLHKKYATRINKEGELVVTSSKTRSQQRNLEDAKRRLLEMCVMASEVPEGPSEEQRARVKQLQHKAKERAKEHKIKRASKKADRRMLD